MKTKIRLKKLKSVSAVFLATVLPLSNAVALTDLQTRMQSPKVSRDAAIRDFGLVRLWALDTAEGFENDLVMGDARSALGVKLINKRVNLMRQPVCPRDNFVYFNKGMIQSDETFLIDGLLNEAKTYKTELANPPGLATRLWNATAGKEEGNRFQKALAASENREAVRRSTSLLEVKPTASGGMELNSTDYTIGGWFKPNLNGDQPMMLFRKLYADSKGQNAETEWEIWAAGNRLYFHNYRYNSANPKTYSKYLTAEMAAQFRAQNNKFYDVKDYAEDAQLKFDANAAKKGSNSIQTQIVATGAAVPLQRVFTEPPQPPLSKKPPVVIPPVIPPVVPPVIPPVVPPGMPPVTPPGPPPVIPPGHPPKPPLPPIIIVPPIDNGHKEYTANFDLKEISWAMTLGSTYSRIKRDVHQDSWTYISFSVHLNDPLGPYVDLVVIQDPNEKLFRDEPIFAKSVKTVRWELDRNMLSRPALNPYMYADKIEKTCQGSSCVKSVLQVGSVDANVGYKGFMRGIYISKKALRPDQSIEMASQFYPHDIDQCTYNNKID